ncbi:MAG TPA: FtsQ-type POTRA domain-containing protein [Longimicrobium sp.]
MMNRRRALRLAGFGVIAAAAASSPLWGPRTLRRVPLFDADRVEVAGTRMLAPHEVVAASGIRIGASVWTDPAAWEAALRRHPVIASAEVERRLPATLRIRITEKRPAALVQAGTLRPATAEGELLPVDPARVTVDLPLAGSAPDTAHRVRDRASLRLLAEAGRLADADPMLMARVSEVRAGPDGALRLALAHPAAEVLLPAGAAEPRLTQLRAALDDVGRRIPPGGRATVDARFADQVVVRLPRPAPAPVPASPTVPAPTAAGAPAPVP